MRYLLTLLLFLPSCGVFGPDKTIAYETVEHLAEDGWLDEEGEHYGYELADSIAENHRIRSQQASFGILSALGIPIEELLLLLGLGGGGVALEVRRRKKKKEAEAKPPEPSPTA